MRITRIFSLLVTLTILAWSPFAHSLMRHNRLDRRLSNKRGVRLRARISPRAMAITPTSIMA